MDDPTMIKNAVGGNPQNALPGGISQLPANAFPANDMGAELSSIDRRMRVIEERLANMRKRAQVEEQNTLKSTKKFQSDLKATDAIIRELRVEIADLKSKFKILINELKLYATKEEMKVVEKYVNMWEPVTFVTRAEVENMVRRIVEDEYHLAHENATAKRNMHVR